MHNKNFLHFVAIATLGIGISFADKITLKSGTTFEGKVIKETETEYVMEVFITRTIKDRKTYKKSEVASIEAEAPDLKPYEALKGTLPTPNGLTEEEYTTLIATKVRPFVEKHPKSQHIDEVKEMLATLEDELKRVQAGEVRLNGEWVSAEAWNANAYDYDAQIELGKMKAAAKLNRYRSALIAYDELAIAFPASDALNEAKDIARGIVPKYLSIISAKASSAREKKTEREMKVETLPSRDRTRVKNAYAEEEARHQAALDAVKESRSKWLPEYDFDERTLKSLERNISSFSKTLDRPSRERKSNSQLFRDGWEIAGKGDIKGIEKILSNMKSAKMDDKYLQLIQARLEANPAPEPKEMEEKPEVTPTPKPAEEEPEEEEAEEEENEEEPIEEDLYDDGVEEEESSGSIVSVILGLALIGILVGVLLKVRKSKEEE